MPRLLRSPAVVLLIVLSLAACRPQTAFTTLVPEVPTQVFVEAREQVYTFTALDGPTTLELRANPVTLAFVAEVRGADGTLAATVSGGGPLEDAQVTLPGGSGVYEVRVRTDGEASGTVQLIVSGGESGTPILAKAESSALTPEGAVAAGNTAGACQLTAGDDLVVHRAPLLTAEAAGGMSAGGRIAAEARAGGDDGRTWYRVRAGAVVGWVPGEVMLVAGPCDALPMVNAAFEGTGGPVAPPLPANIAAPFDAEAHTVAVDPSGGGAFSEVISAPNGDTTDSLWLAVNGVPAERTYTLKLFCEGAATPGLRWGTPENPSLGCDGVLEMAFSPDLTRRRLMVTLPEGSARGRVNYTLQVTAAAPTDAEVMLFPAARATGGVIAEALSYPDGDRTDRYVLRATDLEARPPHNSRLFALRMACDGPNAASLRWDVSGGAARGCGAAVVAQLDATATDAVITITLPEGSTPGYLNYRLTAVPIANPDREAYTLSVDRDAGGQFSEAVSTPDGDSFDRISLAVANLTVSPPDNYREFHVSVLCDGAGVEHLRWGMPDDISLGCGATMTVPTLAGMDTQAFVVALGEGSTAYVHYTLVARPVHPLENTP